MHFSKSKWKKKSRSSYVLLLSYMLIQIAGSQSILTLSNQETLNLNETSKKAKHKNLKW